MKIVKKVFLILLLIAVPSIIGAIIFSPYGRHDGFSYKLVATTTEINAPADSVFAYLGNSAHAHDWSVFVDHISSLNADSFADGKPGSRRRCFQQADEKGIRWDELITAVEPGKRRQLTIYNMIDFPMQADNLATEQLYTATTDGKCRLTFTLFYLDGDPSFWDEMKTYFAAYKVQSVFQRNIANIKRITEKNYGRKS